MGAEAYTVGYDKVNYHAPIMGESPEQELLAREQEMTDNMVRYLGEYRLGVKFDEFFYQIGQDAETGEQFFTSKEPGPIRDIYRKSIKARNEQGLSVRREVAECLGFEKLEKDLLEAPIGTMAIWISPPGEREDGYGEYSFTFLSQVVEVDRERSIRMVPYRNEKTQKEHNSDLSRITGEEVDFKQDVEFLSSPFIIQPSESIQSIDDMLVIIGEEEKFSAEWSEKFITEAWPLLQGYLYLVKTNASDEELIQAKHALENYAIAFKKDEYRKFEVKLGASYETSVRWVIQEWGGAAPPEVRGSCGSTGEGQSTPSTLMEFQNTFGKGDEDDLGGREFNCPSCDTKIRRPYNQKVKKCPNVACKDPESVGC